MLGNIAELHNNKLQLQLNSSIYTPRQIALVYLFMFSCTHFRGSWMVQGRYHKSVRGDRAVNGYCPSSRQKSAGASAWVGNCTCNHDFKKKILSGNFFFDSCKFSAS